MPEITVLIYQEEDGSSPLRAWLRELEPSQARGKCWARIKLLRERLKDVLKGRVVQRASRQHEFKASLVGYTNVGKSSILRALSGAAEIHVENRLFATLDPLTREVRVGDQPRLRIRSMDRRTIGTSPLHPRSPPVYSYRTSAGSRPTALAARSAIWIDDPRVRRAAQSLALDPG